MNNTINQMIISGKEDLAWFDSNIENIKIKYNEMFIAFKNEEIMDTDPNLDALLKKLKNKGINSSDVFIKFVSKVKAIL